MRSMKTRKLRRLSNLPAFLVGGDSPLPSTHAFADLFQNLDFEDERFPAKDIQPLRRCCHAGQQVALMQVVKNTPCFGYDDIALDSPCVSVHNSKSNYLKPFWFDNYTVMLQTGSPSWGMIRCISPKSVDVPSAVRFD